MSDLDQQQLSMLLQLSEESPHKLRAILEALSQAAHLKQHALVEDACVRQREHHPIIVCDGDDIFWHVKRLESVAALGREDPTLAQLFLNFISGTLPPVEFAIPSGAPDVDKYWWHDMPTRSIYWSEVIWDRCWHPPGTKPPPRDNGWPEISPFPSLKSALEDMKKLSKNAIVNAAAVALEAMLVDHDLYPPRVPPEDDCCLRLQEKLEQIANRLDGRAVGSKRSSRKRPNKG